MVCNRRTLLAGAGALSAIGASSAQSVEKSARDMHRESGDSGFVSVRQFGAKFDGVTDDTAAINSALNSGYSIEFPSGVSKISGPLLHAGAGVRVRGAGRGLTTIMQHSDNVPIFVVSGARLDYDGFTLSWNKVQSSSHENSAAIKVSEKTGAGIILASSVFNNIQIKNCAKGVDFSNAAGYSCSFSNFVVSSFSISAISSDDGTAFTQCYFNAWVINNQPGPYIRGVGVSGSEGAIRLLGSAARSENFYTGMSLVSPTAGAHSGAPNWITSYDVSANEVMVYPPARPGGDTVAYEIAQMPKVSGYPVDFRGFTDLRISMMAVEFVQLSSAVPAPFNFENCQVVSVSLLRMERVSFSAKNSAFISAAGRTVVRVEAVQSQYCAAIAGLGAESLYYARTFAQAVVVLNAVEADGWKLDGVRMRWALSSAKSGAERAAAPFGGVIFNQIPTGDGTIQPVGQVCDYRSPLGHTAILGRPSAEQRGIVADMKGEPLYAHNLMIGPDVVRFNSPLRGNVVFELDDENYVAGAQIIIFRDSGAIGNFVIDVKFGGKSIAVLGYSPESAKIYCTGLDYFRIQ